LGEQTKPTEFRQFREIQIKELRALNKTTIGNAIIWVENTLISNGEFSLPSKREMRRSDNEICVAVVDITEQEIERPQKDRLNGIANPN